jgi:hypothetical protein
VVIRKGHCRIQSINGVCSATSHSDWHVWPSSRGELLENHTFGRVTAGQKEAPWTWFLIAI